MSRAHLAAAVIAAAAVVSSPSGGQETNSLRRADGEMVPILSYAPTAAACRGVAVLSHGAGGSEHGLGYLATALAADGMLAVVVGHRESGRQALRRQVLDRGVGGGLRALVSDTSAYAGRLMDVAAARQWAGARCAGTESVLLGHSMGAATVMLEAGARNTVGLTGANAFDAYVALSPQGIGALFPSGAWSRIRKPVLSITGTRDGALGGATWQSRTEPFAGMTPGCKWLAVIDGATHLDFGGRGGAPGIEALTVRTIRAFLRGVRFNDCALPPSVRGIDLQAK